MNVDAQRRYETASRFRQALERLSVRLDWQRITPSEWQSRRDGDVHVLSMSSHGSQWRVDFRKNGRRDNRYCTAGLASNWEAEAQMERIVAETLLE